MGGKPGEGGVLGAPERVTGRGEPGCAHVTERVCKTMLQFPPQRVTETPRQALGVAKPRARVDLMQQR